ncbi:hypothetical protein [Chryseobacterium sp. CP-77]|uniref:hypothetical protein n=1 Tax=Chryseobacterium sp. CP-77 TaxID=3116594 RepID=UPI002ED3C8B2
MLATVTTQDGGFLVAGTSYSSKGLDKKEDSKGGSDIWLVRINEFGDELWQKTLGSSSDEEARAVIQTTDLGFFVAGNVQSSSKGYGSKDVFITRLNKDGKELSQIILGGKGLDEVEKMIPTRDGGALLGMYSRSLLGGTKKTENFGEGDYWIVKLDKNGRVEWEKNFGGKGDDHLRTLALTSNGFIIGGESRSERSGNKTVGLEEGSTNMTDYLDGFQYQYSEISTCLWCRTSVAFEQEAFKNENDTNVLKPIQPSWILDFVSTAEGFYSFTENRYIYQYKDHLGNSRLSFTKGSTGALEITDTNNYYAFGMNHIGTNKGLLGGYKNYKYNGKELQETGMYDYGARFYMPDLGRWGAKMHIVKNILI